MGGFKERKGNYLRKMRGRYVSGEHLLPDLAYLDLAEAEARVSAPVKIAWGQLIRSRAKEAGSESGWRNGAKIEFLIPSCIPFMYSMLAKC